MERIQVARTFLHIAWSMSEQVSVKNLRALFENAPVPASGVPTSQNHKASGNSSTELGQTPVTGTRLPPIESTPESDARADHRPDVDSVEKPNSMASEPVGSGIFETHPLSMLDVDNDSAANGPPNPINKDPAAGTLSSTYTPSSDHESPSSSDLGSDQKPSTVSMNVSQPLESPPSSALSPASTISESKPQRRPLRPPKPKSNTKPKSEKSASNEDIDAHLSKTEAGKPVAPALPERPNGTTLEMLVNDAVPSSLTSKNETRCPAPLPPTQRKNDLAPKSQQRTLPQDREAIPKSATFDSLFEKVCVQATPHPFVRAGAVKVIWNRSKLPPSDLSYIWRTVTGNDPTCSALTREQFVLGSRMIDEKLQHRPMTNHS